MADIPVLRADGRNWTEYREKLLRVAAQKNLDRLYDGTETLQGDAEDWQQRNAIAKALIVETIPDSIFLRILHYESAHKFFEALKNLFEKDVATLELLQELQNNRNKREATYGLESANDRVCRRSHVTDVSCCDDKVSNRSGRRSVDVPRSEPRPERKQEATSQRRVERRRGVGEEGRVSKGEKDDEQVAAASGVSLVNPTSSQGHLPRARVDTPQPHPTSTSPPSTPSMPVEQTAPTSRCPTHVEWSRGRVKSRSREGREAVDEDGDVHDPGGQMDAPESVPPSVRLEGEKIRCTSLRVELTDVETNDVDETSAEEARRPPGQSKARKPPRDPVGTPDGDTRRPNGPTKPPDEEEGADGGDGEQEVESTVGHVETNEPGRVEVEGVKNVETKESRRGDKPRGREDKGEESRQVDEPGVEGNEESRSREVEGKEGGQSEGNACQRDGRMNDMGDATSSASCDSSRVETGALANNEAGQQCNEPSMPPTPLPYATRRPTHLTNPPRRRGQLKPTPMNVSKPEHQPDATETAQGYWGSVPEPPQSRTKGTEARTSTPHTVDITHTRELPYRVITPA
ncbi:hypothetical protein PAXINDRAFT_16371 [Paxillus involutus ATCC 200175]|uniref:Uncharacterized protein n=1 Tax=Paxillus involutus ATCC 200175 TaxID=664439 RepID=A0A0C9SRT3_PAXIN|nr:hypothetical protein PAXINDRAFT_16371 [Paxillus involutus ATCC 200175]